MLRLTDLGLLVPVGEEDALAARALKGELGGILDAGISQAAFDVADVGGDRGRISRRVSPA
jgi:hypothetical protein